MGMVKLRRAALPLLCYLSFLLAGCSAVTRLVATATPTPTPLPSATPTRPATWTPAPPTATALPSATFTPLPSFTPTALFYALEGTPLPPGLAPITFGNAASVSALASWSEQAATDLVWSPDGNRLAVANFEDIAIYDVASRQRTDLLPAPGGVVSLAFSPDGRFLASGQREGSEQEGYTGDVDFWRVPSWERLDILWTSSRSVSKVAFSPSGRTFVAALGGTEAYTNQVVLWDTVSWEITRTINAGNVMDIAFSPDGKIFATTPDRYAVKIYQFLGGVPLHYLRTSFTGAVNCLAFSPDGTRLVTGHYDGQLRVWDVAKGSLVQTIDGGAVVQSVAFNPDGSLLASGHGYEDTFVRLFDAANGQLVRSLDGHTSAVDSLAFSPDGRYLASASYDGVIYLWGLRP